MSWGSKRCGQKCVVNPMGNADLCPTIPNDHRLMECLHAVPELVNRVILRTSPASLSLARWDEAEAHGLLTERRAPRALTP